MTNQDDNRPRITRFSRPYDLDVISEEVRTQGVAIVEGMLPEQLRANFDRDVNDWLEQNPLVAGTAHSEECDADFQGRQTKRLIGLLGKMPSSPEIIAHPDLLGWAERMLAPMCSSVALTLAELIEIGPGQPAQFPHRDTGLWPHLPRTEEPVAVNAIVAISRVTKENGGTRVVPRSHLDDDIPSPDAEFAYAVLEPGDALLFRCDTIHAGGENVTEAESRRALSLTYQAGWLRTFENHLLSVPPSLARTLPREVQELVGYSVHDASEIYGGVLGVYEGGHPRNALAE